jgi:hypothetical protein
MTIAPNPQFPERIPNVWEAKVAGNTARRGPLRYEEGLATDTDVPNDFAKGIMQGYVTAPGRPNHNANVFEKYPDETMKQRAHMGSSAWVEAPTFLSQFASEAFADHGVYEYPLVRVNGGRYERRNPAQIDD